MPLPDKYQDEPTVDLDADLYIQYLQSKKNRDGWAAETDRLRELLEKQTGDAHAGTVDGVKVITNRPIGKYAVAQIRADYPDLAQHFVRVEPKEIFDFEAFQMRHPDIAEKYRVHQFRVVGE